MKYHIPIFLLLLGFCGFVSGAAAELEIQEQQGLRYVTGGLDEQERKELDKLAPRFPMHLVFVVKDQEAPASGVKVTVRDVQGAVLLEADSAGPLFFVDVVGGRYTVDAEYAGEKQSQTKDLTGRRYLRLRYTFGEQ